MATYLLSDIHGEQDKFIKLLERINFSEEDQMYILGDVIDRGPDGIPLLEQIMGIPNIELLMGNHEMMFLSYLKDGENGKYVKLLNINGNIPTREGFAKLSEERKEEVIRYLENRPLDLTIRVGGKRYYLVHAFPGETTREKLWTRPDISTLNPIKDCRLVIGHTPVLFLGRSRAKELEYIEELEKAGKHLTIHYGEGYIDLDCGCGYKDVSVRALGCLRLEDMAEFYIT